ncbi:hypothetical protein BpHYR1_010535 [Brachionus plicatilis]|uniref:Uncharacterized protein n=1 Tax=Brachionus plicatilis TaxID=10195 RepID=A0A3M7Q0K6_BRAPC|nr:hypothetical protein BpHYR1_010535 [Brachionus plicatilis]
MNVKLQNCVNRDLIGRLMIGVILSIESNLRSLIVSQNSIYRGELQDQRRSYRIGVGREYHKKIMKFKNQSFKKIK